MKHLVFTFDVISPYAYLAFEQLPQALEGLSYSVEYRPVLLAGLLQHWGQKGPAEIAPKRDWTYRHVSWLAAQRSIRLDMPAVHPFNPLALLRLIVAAGANRRTAELAMHHVWHGGADANDGARVASLRERMAPARDPQESAVKEELRANTQAAMAQGVFGVPTIEVDGKAFFGLEALPMLAAAMRGDAWFAKGGTWDEAAMPREGIKRD